jgi:hypothetical protein
MSLVQRPAPDARPKIPSSTPLCKRCRKQHAEPMVVKPTVIWWWCRKCGYVWGEQQSAFEDGIQGD